MTVEQQLRAIRDEMAAALNNDGPMWQAQPVDSWQPDAAAFDIDDVHLDKGVRVTLTSYGPHAPDWRPDTNDDGGAS